jgi:hypothetical protein
MPFRPSYHGLSNKQKILWNWRYTNRIAVCSWIVCHPVVLQISSQMHSQSANMFWNRCLQVIIILWWQTSSYIKKWKYMLPLKFIAETYHVSAKRRSWNVGDFSSWILNTVYAFIRVFTVNIKKQWRQFSEDIRDTVMFNGHDNDSLVCYY